MTWHTSVTLHKRAMSRFFDKPYFWIIQSVAENIRQAFDPLSVPTPWLISWADSVPASVTFQGNTTHTLQRHSVNENLLIHRHFLHCSTGTMPITQGYDLCMPSLLSHSPLCTHLTAARFLQSPFFACHILSFTVS